jgi:hypothetical protein
MSPLQNLHIPESINKIRKRILKWLLEVIKCVNFSLYSYLSSVNIIDSLLRIYEFELSEKDIYLISITSLFISQKYFEHNPFNLEFILKDIAKDKYSRTDILSTELLILKKTKFELMKFSLIIEPIQTLLKLFKDHDLYNKFKDEALLIFSNIITDYNSFQRIYANGFESCIILAAFTKLEKELNISLIFEKTFLRNFSSKELQVTKVNQILWNRYISNSTV